MNAAPPTITTELRIRAEVLAAVFDDGERAGKDEMLSILSSPQGADVVTERVPLDAETGPDFAVASPTVVYEAARKLWLRRKVLRGIAHSHGGAVFHSVTDDLLVHRLFPAMARPLFTCPPPRFAAPAVVKSDEAVVHCDDGHTLQVQLQGRPILGLSARSQVAWSRLTHEFDESAQAARVVMTGAGVTLEGSGVRLNLELPQGSTLAMRRIAAAPVRWAVLHSLVVNAYRETFALAFVVLDLGGQPFHFSMHVPIHVISESGETTEVLPPKAPALEGDDEADTVESEAG